MFLLISVIFILLWCSFRWFFYHQVCCLFIHRQDVSQKHYDDQISLGVLEVGLWFQTFRLYGDYVVDDGSFQEIINRSDIQLSMVDHREYLPVLASILCYTTVLRSSCKHSFGIRVAAQCLLTTIDNDLVQVAFFLLLLKQLLPYTLLYFRKSWF